MVRECLNQCIENFWLGKGIFLRNFTEQACYYRDLSVFVVKLSILMNLVQVFTLQTDQTFSNTDRFPV